MTESCDDLWEEDTHNTENLYHNYSDTDTDEETELNRLKERPAAYNKGISRHLRNNFEDSNQTSEKGTSAATVSPVEECLFHNSIII